MFIPGKLLIKFFPLLPRAIKFFYIEFAFLSYKIIISTSKPTKIYDKIIKIFILNYQFW